MASMSLRTAAGIPATAWASGSARRALATHLPVQHHALGERRPAGGARGTAAAGGASVRKLACVAGAVASSVVASSGGAARRSRWLRGGSSSCQVARAYAAGPSLDFAQGMGSAAAASVGSGMEVLLVPCLSDNYAPILHDPSTGATAVVDTPEVGPIMDALEQRGWKLTHILNTHHHADHAGGNLAIKSKTGCKVIGPAGEAKQIPGIDVAARDGDGVDVGNLRAQVLEVGGHTRGHIAYHFAEQNVAFVGDTLFVLGCGRIFEGTPEQMWTSLCKLKDLPDETVVYCAHEYTQTNARYATHLGGGGKLLEERVATINSMREAGKPTVPTLLGHEKATNPFIRADSDEIRQAAGLPESATPLEVFAAVRRGKDCF